MSGRDEQPPPPPPSWALPIAVGALATFALHAATLWNPEWWVPVLGACGCSGAPIGLLPTVLALRRDPTLVPVSGFAVGFIAVGTGAIALAIAAVLRGFELPPAMLTQMQESLRQSGWTPEEAGRMVGAIRQHGSLWIVLTAALMALGGGVAGGALTAFVQRRRR